MDLVSIIIPVYNTGEPLRACLDSVINQTYPNLEILIIDDHSTDPLTLDILQEFAHNDSRIKLTLSPENHGVYYCRSVGVSQITGKYFAMLDSDDRMVPDFIERMYEAIIENQTDFVVCDFCNFTLDSSIDYIKEGEWPISEAKYIKTLDFARTDKFLMMPIAVFCKLINTESYRQANLTFDDSFRAAFDQVWCYELFLKLNSFSVLRFNGVNRLLRATSIVRSPTEKHLLDNVRSLEHKYILLKKYNLHLVHRVPFFDYSCLFACDSLSKAENSEVRKNIKSLVGITFKKMGYKVNPSPSKLDIFIDFVCYKLFKLLSLKDSKIMAKARYKLYKQMQQK